MAGDNSIVEHIVSQLFPHIAIPIAVPVSPGAICGLKSFLFVTEEKIQYSQFVFKHRET